MQGLGESFAHQRDTWGIQLPSWTATKQIATSVVFVLQGDAGAGYVTIPATEYLLDRYNGRVYPRVYDGTTAVNWFSYTAVRASGAVYDSAAVTTTPFTNQAQTFGVLDETPMAYDPITGQVSAQVGPPAGLLITAQQFTETIASDNFVTGAAGWQITRAGVTEFQSGTYRGTVYASAGEFAHWDIGVVDAYTLSADNGKVKLNSQTPYISLGNAVLGYLSGAGFWVGKDAGTWKLHIGNPTGDYLSYDGSQLYVSGTIAGTVVAGGTDSNSWTINQDLTNTNVDLVLARTTGGNATMRWNGTLVSLDKSLEVTGNITVSGNVDGVDVSAFNAVQFVTLATNANVANERVLTGGAGLTLTDGGAGSTVTLAVGAGSGITVNADDVAINLAATSGLNTTSGLALDDAVAGAGLTISSKVLAVGAGNGITVNANDVALTTPGTLTVSTSNNAATNHTHAITSSSNPGAAASLLATDASGFLTLVKLSTDTLTDKSGGNLTISPTGDVIFDPTGNDILPTTNYDLNIGSLSKKYLTLHAAELWVETLVAQNTIATIGGRILVGPTTVLTADLAAGGTTITVKHNEMANGDRVYLEANGAVEFMAVTSAAGGSAGAYTYSVTRNLDGSGANQWYAGDAVFNTGTTDDFFIDIYSVSGVKSAAHAGPTIVGNVRNSATYNDWSEVWAIGNLNGLYGYGADTYGSAFGKYGASLTNVTMDATNGFCIRNYTTTLGQWAADGDLFIGTDVGSDGANPATTGFAIFNTSQTFGSLSAAQGDVVFGNASGKRLFYDASSGVLDLIGNVRISDGAGANYGVNVGEALLLARFDGARPYESNFTGNGHGHRGQVPTTTGGVIYRDGKFGKGVQIAEATTNLITNPSFEYDSGMTGWSTTGTWATNSRSSEQAKLGTYSNKLVNSSGSDAFRYATFTATVATSTVSIWVYRSVASGSVTLYLQENFAPFGIIASTTATSTTGAWQRLIVSGATTATSSYRLILGAATGNTLYIDGGQAESKSYVTPYCDGSLGSGHSWNGTDHNSTSSRTAATLTYSADGNINLTQGSISYWFYMPASNTTPCYDVGVRIDANNYLSIRHVAAGARTPLVTSASGGSAVENSSPSTAATNTWHHIVVTWTAGALKLYLDGVQSGATATYVVPSGTPSTIEIGSFNLTQYANTVLDDVAILPNVLTATEIRALYDSNAPLVAESNVAEWRVSNGAAEVWGNANGLFGRNAAGLASFALLNADGVNATSWGGASEIFDSGDQMLGHNAAGYGNQIVDVSAGKWALRIGATEYLRASVAGLFLQNVLSFGAAGGWFTGPGTFASPTTGWKAYNKNNVGLLEFWAGGQKQMYSDDAGFVYWASGALRGSANGIEMLSQISGSTEYAVLAYAGTGANDAAAGNVAWTNPGNATTNNNSRATSALNSGQTTQYLKMTNFGFAIPSTATITSIGVEMEFSQASGVGAPSCVELKLVKGGTISGSSLHAQTLGQITGSTSDEWFGTSGDLSAGGWNVALTPSDVNASTFGAVARFDNAGATDTMRVDATRIVVRYTDSASKSPINANNLPIENYASYAARAYNSANISIATGTPTALTFDSERYDTDGIHSTSSNTGRLTCQHAGKYHISATLAWAANITGVREATIRLNATTGLARDRRNALTAGTTNVTLSTIYDLVAGDYVELVVEQTSGVNLNVVNATNYSPEFMMAKIA